MVLISKMTHEPTRRAAVIKGSLADHTNKNANKDRSPRKIVPIMYCGIESTLKRSPHSAPVSSEEALC